MEGSETDHIGTTRPGPITVSAVVPVWNPGPNLTRCVDSLLAQQLPREQYEIVLVDDGSTDGTGERLDALAAAHPGHVRVVHIPNSGWPGRPRNVGLDEARGEFVHFVDNDDVLPPYALPAMVAAAKKNSADVVLGKPVSDFRGLTHRIYRENRTCTLAEFPELTETLTPHKMFRREFLHDHGIRFPEGPVPLEDQFVVLPAFIHARAITVLGDRPYYYYLRRIGSGRNAGDKHIDIDSHFAAVEQVLDIVDAVPDPQLRDQLSARFYRTNLLRRVGERAMLDAPESERAALVETVRRIVATRVGAGVTESVGAAYRMQGALLAGADTDGLVALAQAYSRVWLHPATCPLRSADGALSLTVDTYLAAYDDEPLRCDRADDGWALPVELAPSVSLADRLLDDARNHTDVEVSLISRATSASFGVTSGLSVAIDDGGVVRVRGTARIDPSVAMAGSALTDGLWDVRLRLRFAGWDLLTQIRTDEACAPLVGVDGTIVAPSSSGALTLDVGQWGTSLASVLAGSATVACPDRRSVLIDSDVTCSVQVPATVLFEPVGGGAGAGAGAIRAVDGALTPDGRVSVSLPAPLPAGAWRPWLRVAHPAGEAVALGWQLDVDGRTISVRHLVPEPV